MDGTQEIDGVRGMNVPKNRAIALQGVKKTLVGGKKRWDLRRLRVKLHYLKNTDPLLDIAVSYSAHP